MRHFLLKLGILLLTFVLITSTLFFGIYFLAKNQLSKSLTIDKSKTILIIGDSNTECAFNDSLIINSINLSQSGDSYFYSYTKIRELLKNNNQIKTVILGYSFHNIDKTETDRWYVDDNFFNEKFPKYFLFYNYDDQKFVFSLNPDGYVKLIPNIINRNIRYIMNPKINSLEIGGYLKLNRNKLKEDQNRIIKEFKGNNFVPSLYQCSWLLNISKLCKEKGVKLVLLNSPKHKAYLSKVKKENLDFYYRFIQRDFNGILLLDYSKYTIPDSGFGDCLHLNSSGADLFTLQVKNEIMGL